MVGKKELLGKFALTEKTVHLESIDADVTVRNFTSEENDKYTSFMVKGLDKNGDPEVDVGKSLELKYMKISDALVEPKISAKEIKGMCDAKNFIEEMIGIIDGKDKEKYDEEGNDD